MNQESSRTLKIIKCPNTTFTDEYMKDFANSLTGKEVVEETQTIEGTSQSTINDGENIEQKYITLDLTNIAKKIQGNNPTFMFVIKNDNTTDNLHLFNPEFAATKMPCCIATMTNYNGLNSIYRFDEHTIDDTDFTI